MSRWLFNGKEAVVVAALLISTFVGSAFAGPALEKAFAPPPAAAVPPQAVQQSVDIDVFRNNPGAYIYQDNNNSGLYYNGSGFSPYHGHFASLLASFSFAPVGTFQKVDAVTITFVYQAGVYPMPNIVLARLNSMDHFTAIQLCDFPGSLNFTGVHVCSAQEEHGYDLLTQNLSPGADRIELVTGSSPTAPNDMILYELRLTISYTTIP